MKSKYLVSVLIESSLDEGTFAVELGCDLPALLENAGFGTVYSVAVEMAHV